MKTTININGNPVEITLTAEQLSEIEKKRKAYHYTDVKTFEDACRYTCTDIKEFEETFKNLPRDTYAYEQLKVICKALNDGHHLDYKDTSEYKYYPWFNSVGSSVGFSYRVCLYGGTLSDVGSRLTYKSSEIAKYAGQQFIEIYNNHIN